MRRFRNWAIAALVLLLALQLVPYGHGRSNPPVSQEPPWDSPRTRELVARACFDCHSNETRWPWYSRVAPVSWLVTHDVEEGRHELNFSQWDRPQDEAENAVKRVANGDMPLAKYLWLHPEARLSEGEKQELMRGLTATIDGLWRGPGGTGGHSGPGRGEHEEAGEEHEH